jgi:hypothetical protein
LGLVLLLLYLNLCGMRDSEQVVHFMLAAMAAGDFYIICPDNDVTRDIDNRRVLRGRGHHPQTARRCRAGIRITPTSSPNF